MAELLYFRYRTWTDREEWAVYGGLFLGFLGLGFDIV